MQLKKLFLFIIFISGAAAAQEKLFTVEDVVFNSYAKLAPERISGFQFIPDEDGYTYVKTENESSFLVKSFVNSDKEEKILTMEDLNISLKSLNIKTPSRFPRYEWDNSDQIKFTIKNKVLIYDFNSRSASVKFKFPEKAANISISPDGNSAAYTIDNNLFLAENKNDSIRITNESDKNILCGQAVHRNEFGINSGIFWSPKSNYIAFYRMDQTMVTDYTLVDLTTTPAKVENIKYPMAGQTSHQVTLGVYDIHSGKTVYMKTGGPKDHYLTAITWDPNEKYIYIGILNRDQNDLKFTKFNIADGSVVKTLFEEKNDKYVEPENPAFFIPGNDSQFLWFSERDGFNHFYRYDTEGNLINQVTRGNFPVINFAGFDDNGENVFFVSNKENPTQTDFYKAEISTGKITRLTTGGGAHQVMPNSNFTYFLDIFNSLSIPGITRIFNSEGKIEKELLVSKNPVSDYKLGKIQLLTLKSDAGDDLYCRMITPPDFDRTKKYPVIVYVYGGPHVQLVTDSWIYGRYSFWFQLMAQKGYIVFTLDNRGSANRGLKFEQATFRHLGTVEIKDQLAGVNYLKSLPYVDGEKIGVFGWSFGGFMTTSLMTRTNGAFKVGVGGGAVIDWKYYEVMYTERYMDTPQTNPEGYKEASLLNHAEDLSGKLLLVHGTSDPVVVWQNTLNFAKKCADLNKPLDYFPYPGHQHGITGIDALHLYNKITDYFLTNLK